MNINFKKSTVIKNSRNFSYNFYLTEFNGIDYDFFNQNYELVNTNSLADGDILEFSVAIDRFDTIHLIALNKLGELSYFTYNDNIWNNTVINILDLKSNNYKYLNLLTFNDGIGFLCSYSNLINPAVWNIEYVSIKPTFEKKNIISIVAGNNFSPYSFAKDKFDNVHLLYRAIENRCSQIYYMNFSPFLNVYKRPPIKISDGSTNSFYPYIFIDKKNQIYALWTKTSSSNCKLECMSMMENDSKFKPLDIPNLNSEISHPIIFKESEMLKIVYHFDNSLGLISSEDWGLSWFQKDMIKIDQKNLYLSRYSSNYIEDRNISKINNSYMFINKNIFIPFSNIFNNALKPLKQGLSEKAFIDFSSNLNASSINCDYLDENISNVEDFMSNNLIEVDTELICNHNYSDIIKKVEIKLSEHKNKNDNLVELLNNLQSCHEKNSKVISKLEDDLDYLKENLENQNNGFFKSLLSKFK